MRYTSLFLALLFSSALAAEEKKDKQMELTQKLLWTTAIAELAATEISVHNGHPERNPLWQNQAVRVSGKIAITLFVDKATGWVVKKDPGKRKAALVFRWCLIGAYAFATGNNVAVSF